MVGGQREFGETIGALICFLQSSIDQEMRLRRQGTFLILFNSYFGGQNDVWTTINFKGRAVNYLRPAKDGRVH